MCQLRGQKQFSPVILFVHLYLNIQIYLVFCPALLNKAFISFNYLIQPCVKISKCKTKSWLNHHISIVFRQFFCSSQSIFDKYMYVYTYVFVYVVHVYFFTVILWLLTKKNRKSGLPGNRKLAFSHGCISWIKCPWESYKFIVMADPNIESSYTYCCSCNLGECLAKFSTMFIPTVPICSD